MLLCLDVHYADPKAFAAGVTIEDWTSRKPNDEKVVCIERVNPYVPGQFYRRELPCLVSAIDAFPERPTTIIVDGYVWLRGNEQHASSSSESEKQLPGQKQLPGLGGHLFEHFDGKINVVGVAKNRFRGANAVEVYRGNSRKPLFVTAAGIDPGFAASCVQTMAGDDRFPKMLKWVDQLCRGRIHCGK